MRAVVSILTGLVLMASSAAQAQTPPATGASAMADRIIAAARNDPRAMRITEDLSTELGPRLAGTPEEARAREWAVARLTREGFAGVRVEPFTITYWGRVHERLAVTGAHSQPLVAAAIGGSPSTPEGGIEAEVVRFANLDALRAATPDMLRGRIAFVDDRMVRSMEGTGYGVAVTKRRECAPLAAERGALGCLIRSAGTSQRHAHVGQGRRAEQGSIPAMALANADADQLTRLLARGPVQVRMDVRTETRENAPSGNVLAEIRGTTRPDEIVVLGCHLDSWDNSPGASDDAVGCGIVTAAALIAREVAGPPARTIRIVWFGSEEVGVLGGRAYAENAARAGIERHVLAGESDSGNGRVWRLDMRLGAGAAPQAAFAAMARDVAALGVLRGNNEGTGGPDVGPLRQLGVPIMDPAQDMSDYFDIHHTPDDTLDRIDPATVAQNVAVWSVITWHAAWTDTDFRATQ